MSGANDITVANQFCRIITGADRVSGHSTSPKIMSMNEDGSSQMAVSDLDIMQLQSVSPDGHWASVGRDAPGWARRQERGSSSCAASGRCADHGL